MTVFEKIEVQQKGKENTTVWMVGEQLKDICRADPACASIVAEDLEVKAMSIAEAEKQIKAYADKQSQKKGSFCVPPNVAERIIREFYGLPAAGASVFSEKEITDDPVAKSKSTSGFLSLEAFL